MVSSYEARAAEEEKPRAKGRLREAAACLNMIAEQCCRGGSSWRGVCDRGRGDGGGEKELRKIYDTKE